VSPDTGIVLLSTFLLNVSIIAQTAGLIVLLLLFFSVNQSFESLMMSRSPAYNLSVSEEPPDRADRTRRTHRTERVFGANREPDHVLVLESVSPSTVSRQREGRLAHKRRFGRPDGGRVIDVILKVGSKGIDLDPVAGDKTVDGLLI